MDATSADNADRRALLKAFDETKGGVKGVVDSGVFKLPKIFVRPSEEVARDHETASQIHERVPTVDLLGIHDNPKRRKEIIEEVTRASESWGFFQVVNHGIPLSVLDGMIHGVVKFYDMDNEEKKMYYSRDIGRNVRYSSSFDLFQSKTASWRDTLTLSFNDGSHSLDPQELPPPCRKSAMEYSKHVEILVNTLLEILSEALGLNPDHLKNMECGAGHRLYCHYYPTCPEPDLAIGISKHSDLGFITILLQSQTISALQVLHNGQWINIQPILGGLVVNIGDLLQLVSNGRFKSNEHRAIATRVGPRISIVAFFSGPSNDEKIYGPIKELISEENPVVYRHVKLGEYRMKFVASGFEDYRALHYYKL